MFFRVLLTIFYHIFLKSGAKVENKTGIVTFISSESMFPQNKR